MQDEEYNAIQEYLGKNKNDVYIYTGTFAPSYLRNQKVKVLSFLPGGAESSTCEAFIQLVGSSGGQCEWIPKNELIKLTKFED